MRAILKKTSFHRLLPGAAAFFLPSLMILVSYFVIGLSPFGWKSIFSLDLAAQYSHFLCELKDIFSGDGSLIYSWSRTLGGEFLGMLAYYLVSPFNLIILLFPKTLIGVAVTVLITVKTGMCGLTAYIYLRKSSGTDKLGALLFSSAYALCGYVVVYGSNIMWLDGVIILPILALSIERMIRKRHVGLFIFSVAYALITNFYIGYMLCIFALLYYFCVFFSEKRSISEFTRTTLKAGCAAVCAVLCSAFMLLPAYFSLTFGKTQFTDPEASIAPTNEFLTEISKFFTSSYDGVDFNGSAYVYCGIITLLFAPLFFTLKNVTKRQKLTFGVLFFIMIASVSLEAIDLLWHGMQFPIWMNHRYSFIISFLLICMASRVWGAIGSVSGRSMMTVAAFLCLVMFQLQFSGVESFEFISGLLPSLILVGVYLCILCFLKDAQGKRVLSSLLLVTVCAELIFSSSFLLYRYAGDIGFVAQGVLENNIKKYSPSAENIKNSDSGLYRTEIYGKRYINDPFSVGIDGLTSSSSTLNAHVIDFMAKLGYISSSNYTMYLRINPASDALLGVKYIISDGPIDNSVHRLTGINGSEGISVYENPYSLPIAFCADAGLKYAVLEETADPFQNANRIYSALLGENVSIFTPVPVTGRGYYHAFPSTENGEIIYTPGDGEGSNSVTFKLKYEGTDTIYCFFPSVYRTEFSVYANGELKGKCNGMSTYTPLCLGSFGGSEISVELRWDEDVIAMTDSSDYFYTLDQNELSRVCELLSAGGITVERHTETDIHGSVSSSGGVVYTSIPYDSGWHVIVDGEYVDTYPVFDTLLSFDMPPGEHTVRIKYVSAPLNLGISLSILGAVVTAVWILSETGKLKGLRSRFSALRVKFKDKK